jgi:hypothetical protein
MSRVRTLFVFALLIGVLDGVNSGATSFVIVPVEVKLPLTIEVHDYRNRPISNVELVVRKGDKEIQHLYTNAEGKATLADVHRGVYELQPIDSVTDTAACPYLELHVSRSRDAKRDIAIRWPAGQFVQTQQLSGRLRALPYHKDLPMIERIRRYEKLRNSTLEESEMIPIAEKQVQLFSLPSREVVGSITTDRNGYFEFPVTDQGMYYIRFQSGVYKETVLLDLDRNSHESVPTLDLLIYDVGVSGSAPGYTSLNKRTDATSQ